MASAAEPLPPQKPKSYVIVALGDSLTEGYGIEKDKAYPALLQKMLHDTGHPEVVVKNAGISGSTTASATSRLKWFLKNKPDVIFLALGANDGLRGVPLAATKKNLKATITLAKKNHLRVWLAGMKMPPNYGEKYTSGFSKMFKEIASKENVPLLPFLLDGVAGHPELNQVDGLHPNEDGHRIIAKKVLDFVLKNLPGQDSTKNDFRD